MAEITMSDAADRVLRQTAVAYSEFILYEDAERGLEERGGGFSREFVEGERETLALELARLVHATLDLSIACGIEEETVREYVRIVDEEPES